MDRLVVYGLAAAIGASVGLLWAQSALGAAIAGVVYAELVMALGRHLRRVSGD